MMQYNSQQASFNAQAGASNANASMWGNGIANVGGNIASMYMMQSMFGKK